MDENKKRTAKFSIVDLIHKNGPMNRDQMEQELVAIGEDSQGILPELINYLEESQKILKVETEEGQSQLYGLGPAGIERIKWKTRGEKREENNHLLLANIKAHHAELVALLGEINGYTYTDGIYRFYHHSFKVDFIQHATLKMVEALRNLLPGEELNKMYLEILAEGTGKVFDRETIGYINQNWMKETRPILEAFFHTKYFLEMAVKYGPELESAPNMLPSGWAGLLYLFNIR